MSVILSLCNKVKIYKKNFLVVKRLNNSFKQKKNEYFIQIKGISQQSQLCMSLFQHEWLFVQFLRRPSVLFPTN